MKALIYYIIRGYIKVALHIYFKKIKFVGVENIPKENPTLFLPNHQNALIDVLLIAVGCERKPWFLARSDIFKKKLLVRFFNFLQMIPIYRWRDGRDSLKNNQAVFERCADLLKHDEALVLFPEANHNLMRRIRPLSKGFIRILSEVFKTGFEGDVQLVPVGVNYVNATSFPDSAAIYFGTPISINKAYKTSDEQNVVVGIRSLVSARLQKLTTHIEDEDRYVATVKILEQNGVDFLNPIATNAALKDLDVCSNHKSKKKGNFLTVLFKILFQFVNAPIILLWKKVIKRKVPEIEFMATFRFAFALVSFPVYCSLLFIVVSMCLNPFLGILVTAGIFSYNFIWVKYLSA